MKSLICFYPTGRIKPQIPSSGASRKNPRALHELACPDPLLLSLPHSSLNYSGLLDLLFFWFIYLKLKRLVLDPRMGCSHIFTWLRTLPFMCLVTQSCPTLCDPMDCSPPGSSVHGDPPGKNTGVGCHAMPSSSGSSQPRDGTQVS